MRNPIYIYTGTDKKFMMIQGYVRAVTDQGCYNSISFLADSTQRGPSAPLISVMCFDNKFGINFKTLTNDTKGRFLTVFAEERVNNGKKSYKALAVSLAPTEFVEGTHPIDDSEVQQSYDETDFDEYNC